MQIPIAMKLEQCTSTSMSHKEVSDSSLDLKKGAESILGIGIDILEIARFRKSMAEKGQKFLDRLFTKKEQAYCLQYQDPATRLCARFCAKEAIVKALGTGFGKYVTFLDIEILNEESGKPVATLSETSRNHFNNPKLLISMSHCKEYASAQCIATIVV